MPSLRARASRSLIWTSSGRSRWRKFHKRQPTAGAYCERVDEQIFEGSVLARIFNQIAKADLIVADMTGRNPNVFYEVGYAHALGKTVILLTRSSDDIPFDLMHYPHIVYEVAEGLFHHDLGSVPRILPGGWQSLHAIISCDSLSLTTPIPAELRLVTETGVKVMHFEIALR